MSCSTSRSSWAVLRRLLLRAHLAGGLLVAGEPGQRVEQAAVLPTVYGRTAKLTGMMCRPALARFA